MGEQAIVLDLSKIPLPMYKCDKCGKKDIFRSWSEREDAALCGSCKCRSDDDHAFSMSHRSLGNNLEEMEMLTEDDATLAIIGAMKDMAKRLSYA